MTARIKKPKVSKINKLFWENFDYVEKALPAEILKKVNEENREIIGRYISQIAIELLNKAQKNRVVPTTPLRTLYHMMQKDIPKTLCEFFTESLKKLDYYQNDEEFHHREDSHSIRTTKPTGKLQKYFKEKKSLHIDGNNLIYEFLDYEIAPLRTTRSIKATGAGGKSSGAGGIDILCYRDYQGGKIPVVIEYKSEQDTSLLYGLVQLLTYASELATENQRKRLHKNYPAIFGVVPEKLELCLLYDKDKQVDKSKRDKELPLLMDWCQSLMRRFDFKKSIAAIRLVELEKNGSEFRFTVTWSETTK